MDVHRHLMQGVVYSEILPLDTYVVAAKAAKIKPAAKLKEMQNNEKLVAVNERIEEAMNYRKELKEFEVLEAERVEKLRQ